MFGLFKHRRASSAVTADQKQEALGVGTSPEAGLRSDVMPASCASSGMTSPSPSPATDLTGPALMRAVREEVRARAVDHQELALAVLADIRANPLDTCLDVTDINEWIDDFLARGGFDRSYVDHQRLRGIIKAQKGVDYDHRSIRTQDRYAGLRARLKRRRGFVPEKVWLFTISTDGFALAPTPERVSRVLVEDHAARAAAGNRTQAEHDRIATGIAVDSGPIQQALRGSAASRRQGGQAAGRAA